MARSARARDPHLAERLKKILVEELAYPVSPDEIRETTSLYGKGLGLGSVDVVSLVVALEEAFDIFFEAEEVADIVESFGSLLAAVRGKLAQRAGPGRDEGP